VKLCPECSKSPWPFVMVAFIAAVVAFLTWLMLSMSDFGFLERLAGGGLVFLAVASTLVHYVRCCMRRHCRHGQGSWHPSGIAR
jgi:hypothetical protein